MKSTFRTGISDLEKHEVIPFRNLTNKPAEEGAISNDKDVMILIWMADKFSPLNFFSVVIFYSCWVIVKNSLKQIKWGRNFTWILNSWSVRRGNNASISNNRTSNLKVISRKEKNSTLFLLKARVSLKLTALFERISWDSWFDF